MHNLFLRVHIENYAILAPLAAIHRVVSNFGTFAAFERSRKQEGSGVDNALRVLDLVAPRKGNEKEEGSCHQRLITDCMHGIVESRSKRVMRTEKMAPISSSSNPGQTLLDSVDSNEFFLCSSMTTVVKEDAFLLLLELHRRGISTDTAILASAMSYCTDGGSLSRGVQLHALLVKVGYDLFVLVGSSLISLYSRCGQLENAYQVFQTMPAKNTVSWTALISGYAQNNQVEPCLRLFALMSRSLCKPNDLTFASLLSVCTHHALFALGRSVHGLEMRIGFNSYLHISNALISMYAKCGKIDESRYVFETISCKDLVSWNSMIFGYSQYGLAEDCLDLLKEMDRQSIVPDTISFLGVLSSCRHACLIEEGRRCFNMMLECGIKPELEHYSCMIDLLGPAGLLNEAWNLIQTMSTPPNAVIWGSLLSVCRVHRNVPIGIRAAEYRLKLEPGCAATYVQLANLYASVGSWSDVARVRKLMKERGLKTNPGCSWTEVGNEVYTFKAENRSNNQVNDVLAVLDCLQCHMEHKSDILADSLDWNNHERAESI